MDKKIKLLQAMRDKCVNKEEWEILNECIALIIDGGICDNVKISIEYMPQLYADNDIYNIPERELIFKFSDGLYKTTKNLAFSAPLWEEIKKAAKEKREE